MSDPTTYHGIPVHGLTLEKMARLTGTVHNVRAYGAVGDASVDDTAAMQAAIDAAEASRGVVYAPDGNYLTTGLAINSPDVTFMGAGPATIISHMSSTSPAFNVSGANCHVKTLKLNGNRGQTDQGAGIILQGNYTTADGVWVVDAGSNAIYAHTAFGQRVRNFLIQTPGASGVLVSDAAKNVIVAHGHVFGADQRDIVGHSGVGILGHASVTRDVTVMQVHVQDSRGNAIRAEKIGGNAPEGVRIIGCHVDTTGLGDFDGEGINASGIDIIVDGCFVTTTWTVGVIVLGSVENVVVSNNIVKNSSQDPTAGDHPAIQVHPNGGTQTGVLVSGNIGYDDQATPTQATVVGVNWSAGGTTDATVTDNIGRNNINAQPVMLSDNGKRGQVWQSGNVGDGDVYPETSFSFTPSETAPSVRKGRVFQTNNSVGTTITDFVNGQESQQITIYFGDANTTITHGTNIILESGSNFTGAVNDVLPLVNIGGTWYETTGSA
jgi:polygalacturonase